MQCYALTACADLLGIPEDPVLAQPSAAPSLESSPALTLDDGVQGGNGEQGVGAAPVDGSGMPRGETIAPLPIVDAPAGATAGTDAGASPTPAALADGGPRDAGGPRVCADSQSQGPNGNCYSVVSGVLSGPDARARCRTLGTGWDLAAVHDEPSNSFVAGLVAEIAEEAWIGGSDAEAEGTWLWLRDGLAFWSGAETGEPLNQAFANWNSDEPNGEDDSNCVRMVASTARWADLECEELRSSVCEGPAL